MTKPVLVLGLGNLLLSDDAAGLRMLETLEAESADSDVEFVDGGTQGITLTGYFADRAAVLVLDAIGLGAEVGTVHVLRGDDIAKLRARRATNAHEGNGLGLIETACLLGYLPPMLAVVGVEPANVRTGIGISPEVERGIHAALIEARSILKEVLANTSKEPVCA
jgi:hydrogenase maturation protease